MNFSTLLKLAGIAVGIISVTILAWRGTDLPFHALLVSGLEVIEGGAEFLARPLQSAVIQPILDWLRERGLHLELYPHWKYAFTLLWLFFASVARAYSASDDIVRSAFDWSWGTVVALAASIAAGTAPLSSTGVLWWPAAGYCLYMSGSILWDAAFRPAAEERQRRSDREQGQVWFGFACLAVLLGTGIVPIPLQFPLPTKSPGLAFLVVGVVGNAIWLILFSKPGPIFLSNVRAAVDVLAVMGGATAIVTFNYLLLGRS